MTESVCVFINHEINDDDYKLFYRFADQQMFVKCYF